MHFNRVRVLLVSMLAVFAFGAVASASASADTFGWEVAGSELAAGAEKKIDENNVVLTADSTLKGAGITIECSEVKVVGGFIKGRTANGAKFIEFKDNHVNNGEKCDVSNPTKCEVTTPIKTGEVVSTLEEGTPNPKVTFSPKPTSTEFATIVVKSIPPQTCLQAKSYKVTGKATGELTTSDTETQNQTLKFSGTAGGNLKIAGNPVEEFALEDKELRLNPLENWSVNELGS